MHRSSLQQAIWQIVAAIPSGKVATYGQVAALAGYPGHARYVGKVLKELPAGTRLPWFRVVNGKGEISFPLHSEAWHRQKDRLEAEGIVFSGKRFSLARHQWENKAFDL